MYQSNRSLNILPPGIHRAFDVFCYPGGREFDELSVPRGGTFDHYSSGVGNLIASFDFMLRRADSMWRDKSWQRQALMRSKRKIPDSWRTGWKAKACTSFALYLKVFKNHLCHLRHVRVLSIKPCLQTQLPKHNRSYWKVSRVWGHLITWNGPIMGHLNSFSALGGGNIWTKIFQKFKCPGGCPGGMFKLRFDWYISKRCNYLELLIKSEELITICGWNIFGWFNHHASKIVGFFPFIPGGFKVFFVALVQSFSHYNNVAQKLVSINLFICYLFIYLFIYLFNIYLFNIRIYFFSTCYSFITELTSCQSTNSNVWFLIMLIYPCPREVIKNFKWWTGIKSKF